MPLENTPIEVSICLGSSCFARGNSENLVLLKKFEQENKGRISVTLTGNLCQDRCIQGPNVTIDGQLHSGIGAEQLRTLLQGIHRGLKKQEVKNHGTA